MTTQRPSWTDEHERLVRRAEPAVPAVRDDEVDRVWQRVRGGRAPEPRRRRRLVVWCGSVAAVVAVSVGGVAIADGFSAHTGKYPRDAEDLRLGGPGEYLDPAAPDFGTVLIEVTRDIPFPDNGSRQVARDFEVEVGRRDAPRTSSVSTGGLRFQTARWAVCAWADVWASTGGAAKKQAATMLEAAPAWSAVTDVDPVQTLERRWVRSTDEVSGADTSSWVWDNTPAGYFPLVRRAAAAGDERALAKVLREWGACGVTDLVPDFPQALNPDER